MQGKDVDTEKWKKVTYTWLKYRQKFLEQHFDEIVKGTVLFAKAGAQRFRTKDSIRAKHIAQHLGKESVLVEAGRMRFFSS